MLRSETREERLSALPNIGNVLEKELIQVGIRTKAELKACGSENAFIRIRTIDENACFNKLCALEGAIQGMRWTKLSPEIKYSLKAFYNSLK
ncbi:competence protein TfoX [Puteibacter caeruleilacunae]|nr:competence protein TfoX [Puteibacter caeruleilacunae]